MYLRTLDHSKKFSDHGTRKWVLKFILLNSVIYGIVGLNEHIWFINKIAPARFWGINQMKVMKNQKMHEYKINKNYYFNVT